MIHVMFAGIHVIVAGLNVMVAGLVVKKVIIIRQTGRQVKSWSYSEIRLLNW